MTKFKLVFAAMLILMACKKEPMTQPATPPRCGYINDKGYLTYPPDTTKHYFIYWTHDTICPPANPQCGRWDTIGTDKDDYDTLFRNRYPERRCF